VKLRWDREGGVIDDKYYLKSGGFFNTDFGFKKELERRADDAPPSIDFESLP
jgi:hypothetical protein